MAPSGGFDRAFIRTSRGRSVQRFVGLTDTILRYKNIHLPFLPIGTCDVTRHIQWLASVHVGAYFNVSVQIHVN